MEEIKTIAVKGCNTFEDLVTVIEFFETFISYSKGHEVVWNKNDLFVRIQRVMDGGAHNLITRANGLRSKVLELL